MSRPGARLLIVALILSACTEGSAETTTSLTSTTTSIATTTSTEAPIPLEACRRGVPRPGVDLAYETFFDAYKLSFTDQLVSFLGGDGRVEDPWLTPDHEGVYPDVASWVSAGNELTDRFYNSGYGMGDPFQVFTTRRNEYLESQGITDLTLTLDIWSNQDCEWRVQVHSPVASPDPCLLEDAFPYSGIEVCNGPFPPTAYQKAVWTGEEVFYIGGGSGGLMPRGLPPSYLFSPITGALRQTSPPPVEDGWGLQGLLWDGSRALVIGQPFYEESRTDFRPSIVAFDPSTDTWTHVTTFPDTLQFVGATVFTGTELIFAGGRHNQTSDAVWVYSLAEDLWREVIDAPIPSVEETRGVWTGSEAIFVGGYSGIEEFVHHAYDPVRDTWRELQDPGVGWIEYQELLWTGSRVIVAPMHIYNETHGVHNSLRYLVYDPVHDEWSWTAEIPIQPPIRGVVSWNGDELLVFGGFSGSWHPVPDGAAYNPDTDTWRVLSPAPLSTRTDHSGTWTEVGWVIIGGSPDGGTPGQASYSDGAIYDPVTDTWEYLGGDQP